MQESAPGLSVSRGAAPGPKRRARRPWTWLFGQVDIASLVVFRVAFGALMMLEVWRLAPEVVADYVEPRFHFTYYGFAWVRPWPGEGMVLHFAVLGLAALGLTLGLCYRAAAIVFFVGISHVFLIEQAFYLNHMYLIALISFLMIFVPAHRAGSLDAWLRPAIRSQGAPAWALWLLRAQIGIPYVYAGIAKINADWLRGEPLRGWLRASAERGLIDPALAQEGSVYLLGYGGLAFDLLVVPGLLWRRTRGLAFALALGFHLTNSALFDIGVFPWLMIAATTLFLAPDWPRRLRDRVRVRLGAEARPGPALAAPPAQVGPRGAWTLAWLAVYLAWQLLFPLRHWLYPGDVAWTEEGHKFAWRMKLRDKAGTVRFLARDPVTGETEAIDVRPYLKSWQRRAMGGKPEMIHQFARFLAGELRAQGRGRLEIHAIAWASLNGRRWRLLIDPAADLAAWGPSLRPAPWIRRRLPK